MLHAAVASGSTPALKYPGILWSLVRDLFSGGGPAAVSHWIMDPYGYPLRPFLSMTGATAQYSSHGPYIFGNLADSQGHRAASNQQVSKGCIVR